MSPTKPTLITHTKPLLCDKMSAIASDDKVLVYHYRANGSDAVVKGGIGILSRDALGAILQNHPNLHTTTKTLAPGARHFDVYQHDLVPASSNATTAAPVDPAGRSNVAGVTLPVRVWIEGLVRGAVKGKGKMGGFAEVIVVSERVGGPATGQSKEATADAPKVEGLM